MGCKQNSVFSEGLCCCAEGNNKAVNDYPWLLIFEQIGVYSVDIKIQMIAAFEENRKFSNACTVYG